MKGLEKLIIDLSNITCPSENGLYQELIPCPIFENDSEVKYLSDDRCISCWKKSLEMEIPE
ncbi:MAG: hypothetical protein K9L62_02130 [Vallitaleaceae bacterium]|nr:hypothetical protein [Vallitaleaceae bacterium]